MALMFQKEGKLSEASQFFDRSLKINMELGELHYNTAAGLINRASLYKEEHKFAEAIESYKKSFNICTHLYGPYHPLSTAALNDLTFGIIAYLVANSAKYYNNHQP